MDNLLIYSQTEGEHLTHLELVFFKFREAGIKLRMSKCEFLKKKIEYLGHLVSDQGISPMKQKIKAITDLAPTTNITEAQDMIGLIGYYIKFFPILSDTRRPINKLTRKIYHSDGKSNVKSQVLKVFKNTLPTQLYWVLFPIEDLRLALETAKRILTKEEIDRPLAGKSSSMPFMSIKDWYNSKKVTFDIVDS